MTTVISAQRLCKAYRIGVEGSAPDSLFEFAFGMLKSPVKNFQDLRRLNTFEGLGEYDANAPADPSVHWALKNVSFDVQDGEVLGVIGKNGAGKSTLLKVLSRITEPTTGRATIRGRVSSLLEVGTGFHPELSGKENIYLNGTILGMTKSEINSKYDEIVNFSGVEKFLNTPIKRYSSGMKVRLAFAVAAHLEPEVLIIDEVLAVGDVEFQKKCIGKMQEISGGGRTVIFVSHDFPSIQSLCTSALVMSHGVASEKMSPDEAIREYSKSFSSSLQGQLDLSQGIIGDLNPRITSAQMLVNGQPAEGPFFVGDRLSFRVEFEGPISFFPVVEIAIRTTTGSRLFACSNRWCGQEGEAVQVSSGGMECDLGTVPLLPGSYIILIALLNEYRAFHVLSEAFRLDVEPSDFFGTGRLPKPELGSLIHRGTFRQY